MPAYRDAKRGTWYVKFRYRNWKKEAKWVTKRGFSHKRDALQWEREFLQKQTGSLEMTFGTFAEVYLQNIRPRIKESTFVMKQAIIEKQIVPFFREMRLQDITTLDVMRWQNELLGFRNPVTNKPYTKSYLKTVHNQLSAILNHAVRYYKLPDNPARTVGNMGNAHDVKVNFWTKEEYLQFAEGVMEEPQAYYCFEMLYWCGIREGELLALMPEDFDFEEKTVTISKTYQVIHGQGVITDPKTPKSNRTVSLPEFLCAEIQDYFRMNGPFQPQERCFPVSKYYLCRKIHSEAKKQGLREIRVHDLRHSHVSLLIDMGFSAVAIAERMGHESIDITYRYAHMFPSAQKAMAKQLDVMRGGSYVGAESR